MIFISQDKQNTLTNLVKLPTTAIVQFDWLLYFLFALLNQTVKHIKHLIWYFDKQIS